MWGMTAVAVKPPFANASPAEIRAALLPEERPNFDREYRRALEVAGETLTLDELHNTVECWRRIAWSTQADPEAHRRTLANAEHTLRTGELPAGSVPWSQLKAALGL